MNHRHVHEGRELGEWLAAYASGDHGRRAAAAAAIVEIETQVQVSAGSGERGRAFAAALVEAVSASGLDPGALAGAAMAELRRLDEQAERRRAESRSTSRTSTFGAVFGALAAKAVLAAVVRHPPFVARIPDLPRILAEAVLAGPLQPRGELARLGSELLEALGESAAPAAATMLEALRKHGRFHRPYGLGRALGRLARTNPELARSLIDLLDSPQPESVAGAVVALEQAGEAGRAALPRLEALAQRPIEEFPYEVLAACRALVAIAPGNETALLTLLAAWARTFTGPQEYGAEDSQVWLRPELAEALADAACPELAARLEPVLRAAAADPGWYDGHSVTEPGERGLVALGLDPGPGRSRAGGPAGAAEPSADPPVDAPRPSLAGRPLGELLAGLAAADDDIALAAAAELESWIFSRLGELAAEGRMEAELRSSLHRELAEALGSLSPSPLGIARSLLRRVVGRLDAHPSSGFDCEASLRRALGSVVHALGRDVEPLLPELVPLLAHDEPWARTVAARALAVVGPGAAPAGSGRALLAAASRSRPEDTELLAAFAGFAREDPALVAALLPRLELQASPEGPAEWELVRVAAAALEAIGPAAATARRPLLRLLELPAVAAPAALALSAIAGDDDEVLADLLRTWKRAGDPRDDWRSPRLVRAIGRFVRSWERVLPVLIEALGERIDQGGASAADEAALAIARIGPSAAAAVPALVKALADHDDFEHVVKGNLVAAIAAIGPAAAAALPALEREWRHGVPDLRSSAARAIEVVTGKSFKQPRRRRRG